MNPFPPALVDFFLTHLDLFIALLVALFVAFAFTLMGLLRSAHDADEHLDDYFDSRPHSVRTDS